MKWITRHHVKVDRVACPWLITRFIDMSPEFLFAPPEQVMEVAARVGAIPYDVEGVELGHHGHECSFEAILKKYNLTGNAALMLLSRIVNEADTQDSPYRHLEGPGLKAIAVGFSLLGLKDDHAILDAEFIVYDALYAWCQKQVK